VIRTRISVAALAVLAIALVHPVAHAQCAMCVTALENSPEGKGMATHFNNGILFLLAIPYALFTTIGIVVYRAHRRKKIAAREADNPYIPRAES
jgi:hypothetical protein